MTETRIRWTEDPAFGGFNGHVGTLEPWAFEIWKLQHSGTEYLLTAALPGMSERRYGPDPDELKAEAERWLTEFVVSLGAVFPEDADSKREDILRKFAPPAPSAPSAPSAGEE